MKDWKEKYPESFKKFIQWYLEQFPEHTQQFMMRMGIDRYVTDQKFEMLVGFLFRFFDEQKIILNIFTIFSDDTREIIGYQFWTWTEYGKEGYYFDDDNEIKRKTRTEAWKASFEKAFKILEEELEKNHAL